MKLPLMSPFRGLFLLLASVLFATVALAQTSATAIIKGRVLNSTTGAYLHNARVTIDGTAMSQLTDRTGGFQFANVPAGPVTLRAFYTGSAEKTASVTAVAGETVVQDLDLVGQGPLVLEKYVVAVDREISAKAMAVNEQRFAPNIKNVVSTDQFGEVTGGNVAEFLKFLPGVSVDYNGVEARTVSVRGLPNYTVPVSIDGNRQASAASGATTRTFEFEQVTTNNFSRAEVTKVPTPDTPADSLGGAINLISRRAFEHTRPSLEYSASLNANSTEASFDRTAGPGEDKTHKIFPNASFSFIDPVSPTFGFTVNGLYLNRYNPEDLAQKTWTPVIAGSGSIGTPSNPAMTGYTIDQTPAISGRRGLGGSLDWKFTPEDTIGFVASWTQFQSQFNQKQLALTTGGVASYGPNFTQGVTGGGQFKYDSFNRDKQGVTYTNSLSYQHDGEVWKFDTGGSFSHANVTYSDINKGHFYDFSIKLPNVTMRFDDISTYKPSVTATNSSGANVDWHNLDNYFIGNAFSDPVYATDLNEGAHANASRKFDLGDLRLTLKVGADARRQQRDIRLPFTSAAFVGRDGIAASADDYISNYPTVLDQSNSGPGPYAFGYIQWPNLYALYRLRQQHPEYFSENTATDISTSANNSKLLLETVTAEYLRLDAHFLNNQAWLVVGARYEGTQDDARGVQRDITANDQRDANGNILRDVNGNPLLIPGLTAAQVAALQYHDRGSHQKNHYGSLYPSVNFSYAITDNLILRLAYARTLGRPDLNNIIPSVSLPQPATGGVLPTITVNNGALKPWTANNYDFSLEYYFAKFGVLSAGVFEKDISNFFGSFTSAATPAQIAQYGLDPTYIGYPLKTLLNVGSAKVLGAEVNYRQALTFLPSWGQGTEIFFNATQLHLEGASTSDFSAFIPRNMNYGLSFTRPRYAFHLNWNYRGRQRLSPIIDTNVEPGVYQYTAPKTTLDVDGEYWITPKLSLFATALDLTQSKLVTETYGPSTPSYAKLSAAEGHGIQIAVGVRGSF